MLVELHLDELLSSSFQPVELQAAEADLEIIGIAGKHFAQALYGNCRDVIRHRFRSLMLFLDGKPGQEALLNMPSLLGSRQILRQM